MAVDRATFDDETLRAYVPPVPNLDDLISLRPKTEDPSASGESAESNPNADDCPQLIPLSAVMQQRHYDAPVDASADPHDLFGIFAPESEDTAKGEDAAKGSSHIATATIRGPFFDGTTTVDTTETPAGEESQEEIPRTMRMHGPFRPLLEVDRFVWPRICHRLDECAFAEIDQVAGELVDAMHQGQSVIGLAACQRGEGSTTLLLCAARMLGQRQLRAALLDAHLTRPDLGRRLGLLPEAGWEEVLAGETVLEKVAVESLADRLTVVPLRQAMPRHEADTDAATEQPSPLESRTLETIDLLADHYDLVLVDMGPLDDLTSLGGVLAGRLDSLLLVHNPKISTNEQVAATQQHLAEVQIPQTGIVRNGLQLPAVACG